MYVVPPGPDAESSLVNTDTLVLSAETVKRPAGGVGTMVVEPGGTLQQELSPTHSPDSAIMNEESFMLYVYAV